MAFYPNMCKTSHISILNESALVLNANYAPLTICSVKRAICLVFLGKVDIIEEKRQIIRSPSFSMPMPSVIKLNSYLRYNGIEVVLTRRNILLRDNHECGYCGKKSGLLTIDHIIPRERGGPDTWENLITACSSCNRGKSNRTPEEAGMPLRKRPIKPNRIHYFQQFVNDHTADWRPYLFMESIS